MIKELIIAALLSFGIAVLLLDGCGGPSELQQQKQKEVGICIDMGGVPVRSGFDSTVMTDCKFPPGDETPNSSNDS